MNATQIENAILRADREDRERADNEMPFGPYDYLMGKNRTPDPCDLLRPYIMPLSVPDALEYLDTATESIKLLALYEHYFPAEWEASSASTERAEVPANNTDWTPLSEAEREFCQLVDERFFPVSEFFDWEECYPNIPIMPEHLDWYESQPQDFRPAWQFLLVLTESYGLDDVVPEEWGWKGLNTKMQDRFEWIISDAKVLRTKAERNFARVFWTTLERHCTMRDVAPTPKTLVEVFTQDNEPEPEVEAHPLAALFLAIEMIDHSTGTAWLDSTGDTPIDVTWCRADIDWVREDYKEAMEIMDKVNTLLDWIEADIKNVKELLALWQKCLDITRQDLEGIDERLTQDRIRVRV